MVEKKTKIVATLSNFKCDADFLKQLIDAGVNVFRLNTAHQTLDMAKILVDRIREVSTKVGILIDTKGPEVRTRLVEENQILKKGETITVKYGDENQKCDINTLYFSYDKFVEKIGDLNQILIDDGDIELKVINKTENELTCTVIEGGLLKNNKSVNVSNAVFDLPSLSQKDIDFILFSIENKIDFIAHSFVRNKQDIIDIQTILDEHNSPIKIISKIENREGVDNIDEILDHCFGIMVARGDLAMELSAEEVPVIQKRLILKAIQKAKISITATQMLQSMIDNPRPTRAEVSDIANAVYDGTDAIMLSGESAFGKYPVEAVQIMTKVAIQVEISKNSFRKHEDLIWDNKIHQFLARTAIESSGELPVEAIFAVTKSGSTPRLLSSFRPHIPIYAETFSSRVMRELSIVFGVYPSFISDSQIPTDELVEKASMILLQQTCDSGALSKDSLVLFIGSAPGKVDGADFIEIKEIKNFLN